MPAAVRPCVRCEILKRVGPMNRSLEVQQAVETQDETGQPVATWVTIRGWRAARRDVAAWERVRSDQELGARTSVFTGRWFAGLTSDMRLYHDGLYWDIVGLAELGRRDFHEITATAVRV